MYARCGCARPADYGACSALGRGAFFSQRSCSAPLPSELMQESDRKRQAPARYAEAGCGWTASSPMQRSEAASLQDRRKSQPSLTSGADRKRGGLHCALLASSVWRFVRASVRRCESITRSRRFLPFILAMNRNIVSPRVSRSASRSTRPTESPAVASLPAVFVIRVRGCLGSPSYVVTI